MKKNEFNPIGIDGQLDWPRIRKLLSIGLVASVLHLIADLLIGWGVQDETLTGIERMFSAYGQLGSGALYTAAILGMLSILLEGLSYFGVYRLMAEKSPKHAHHYRTGILGYLMFCPFGFHVMVCAIVYLLRNGVTGQLLENFERYFFLPGYPFVLDLFCDSRNRTDLGICKRKNTVSKVVLGIFGTGWYAAGEGSQCFWKCSVGQCA